jgi:hypothetical protein
MKWVGRVACRGRERAYTAFWWRNLREKDHLGDPKPKWENNIKMDLQAVGCGGMVWIELTQDKYRWRALVNAVINFWVP